MLGKRERTQNHVFNLNMELLRPPQTLHFFLPYKDTNATIKEGHSYT